MPCLCTQSSYQIIIVYKRTALCIYEYELPVYQFICKHAGVCESVCEMKIPCALVRLLHYSERGARVPAVFLHTCCNCFLFGCFNQLLLSHSNLPPLSAQQGGKHTHHNSTHTTSEPTHHQIPAFLPVHTHHLSVSKSMSKNRYIQLSIY